MDYSLHASPTTTKDEQIKKLQDELERLKGARGIGSSSHTALQSQSSDSYRKNAPSGKTISTAHMVCMNTTLPLQFLQQLIIDALHCEVIGMKDRKHNMITLYDCSLLRGGVGRRQTAHMNSRKE